MPYYIVTDEQGKQHVAKSTGNHCAGGTMLEMEVLEPENSVQWNSVKWFYKSDVCGPQKDKGSAYKNLDNT